MPKRYDLEKFSNSQNLPTSKALKFIMRDVIDGMEELANMSGFSPKAGDYLEILSIEDPKDFVDTPLSTARSGEKDSATIIPLTRKKQVAA